MARCRRTRDCRGVVAPAGPARLPRSARSEPDRLADGWQAALFASVETFTELQVMRRTEAAGVYLPEAAVLEPVNTWIGWLLAPAQRDETVRRLLEAAEVGLSSRFGGPGAGLVA